MGPLPSSLEEIKKAAKKGEAGLRPGSLTVGEHQMPFVLIRKESEPVPEEGRALYICMHGGGRNPKAPGPHAWPVNTREWRSQAGLAAEVYAGGGIFFVPRMADDRLGRWHHALNQDAFDSVIEHGIREWQVDPNRVYILGISEGCYGAQILGPFMPDRFASASAMAGGVGKEVPVENLRNLPFRTDVGENDTTFRLMLNDEMFDLGEPVGIFLNGEEIPERSPQRSVEVLARTLSERGDPSFAFPT